MNWPANAIHFVWSPVYSCIIGWTLKTIHALLTSSVARSLVLAGHLLYASRSCALRVSSRDIYMSGTNLHGALAGHVPGQAPPPLRHCYEYLCAFMQIFMPYLRWSVRAIPIAHCKLRIFKFLPSKFHTSPFEFPTSKFHISPFESPLRNFTFLLSEFLTFSYKISLLNLRYYITGKSTELILIYSVSRKLL